ncbi:unnamed protein product, partial [Ectocarpus sp. 13 AM-2016]
ERARYRDLLEHHTANLAKESGGLLRSWLAFTGVSLDYHTTPTRDWREKSTPYIGIRHDLLDHPRPPTAVASNRRQWRTRAQEGGAAERAAMGEAKVLGGAMGMTRSWRNSSRSPGCLRRTSPTTG